MEKLLKLLNKAKPLKKYKEYWYRWNEIYLITYAEDYWASESRNITLDIISKSYGFIKWLTKNDYIDRNKIDELKLIPTLTYHNMVDDCDCGKSHWHPYTFVGDEDELLMLLAIDDNPIEFLISILK